MTDLAVSVANFPALGSRFTTLPGGRRIRNHLQFQLSGYVIDWYQTEAFFDRDLTTWSELDGTFVHTSNVFVRDVMPADTAHADRVVTDLCWLLRLATCSAVAPFATAYDGRERALSVSAAFHMFRPALDPVDGAQIETFVQCCWPAYRRLKRQRRLPVAIDYLVFADVRGLPLEGRLLLAFTAMEHLKYTWAVSNRIPFIGGYFRQVNASGIATRKSRKLAFAELMLAMLAEVRQRRALKRIVAIRNQLVHSGHLRNTVHKNFELYASVVSIIQHYLFRLLGYSGLISDYKTQRAMKP